MSEPMSEHQPDAAPAPIEFRPSADAQVVPDGPRGPALVFLGGSLVTGGRGPQGAGLGHPGRRADPPPRPELTAYNLGVRGDTSADLLQRWASEVPRRWVGRTERRVVVSVGPTDVLQGITLARHRLNLANLLDDAARSGVGTFVVSPAGRRPGARRPPRGARRGAGRRVRPAGRPFVDCFAPLMGHDQWRTDLADEPRPAPSRQAGYGLIAARAAQRLGGVAPDRLTRVDPGGRQADTTKSRSRSAKRSGSSRCGKCPAPSKSSTRQPGIERCAEIACHAGIIRSFVPQTTRVGTVRASGR